MRCTLLVVALICAQPAMAAKSYLHIVPSDGQNARMDDGRRAVLDTKPSSAVQITQSRSELGKRGTIQIVAFNSGAQPFDFGTESITAKLADGTPVSILTYEALMREERRREGWQAFATGLAAAGRSMNAANAGTVTSYGSYSGMTTGTFGATPYTAMTSGTGTVTTYDPARAQLAQATANQQNQAEFAALAARQSVSRNALNAVLKTSTIDPSKAFGGLVWFEIPSAARKGNLPVALTITVTTGGEQHTFSATIDRTM